jgi:hypothetical protein
MWALETAETHYDDFFFPESDRSRQGGVYNSPMECWTMY